MRINHIYCFLFLAAAVFAGCGKENPDVGLTVNGEAERVGVSFCIDGQERGTKSTASFSEETIINAYFFLFSGSQLVDKCASGTTLYVNKGSYKVYTVANYPTSGSSAFVPSQMSSVSDIKNYVSNLSDNQVNVSGGSKFLMFGEDDVTVTGSGPVYVNAKRLVAKLGIKKITVNFPSQYSGSTFTIRRIYAANVYSKCRLGSDYSYSELSGTSTMWYNREYYQSSAVNSLIADIDINYSMALNTTRSYNVEHYFYVYPNATLKGNDSNAYSWSKRCTRIVIVADIDDVTFYFQITPATTSKGIVRNNTYIADEVVITGLDSKDVEITWQVWDSAWDGTDTINETS